MIDTPSVRRQLIGAALRRYRENLGYALEDAARVLECDRSKISRIETGQRGIRPKELRELLTEYGVGEPEQATLTTIASPRNARGWWGDYDDVVSTATADYLSLEAAASELLIYEAQQIPDLLQTQEYAEAIAAADPGLPEPGTHRKLANLKLARQRVIMDERRSAFTAIIGEGALRQVVGGADVMRGQLARLAQVSCNCPWATIQVLPFECGAHAASGGGSMAVVRFTEAPNLGVVHLAGMTGFGTCLVGEAEVASYVSAFDQLKASALRPAESSRVIREIAMS